MCGSCRARVKFLPTAPTVLGAPSLDFLMCGSCRVRVKFLPTDPTVLGATLARLFFGRYLSQGNVTIGHPGADKMQRPQRLGRVEGMPQCLSVNGHHREAIGQRIVGHESVEPVEEASLKCDRIDFPQERSDAISAGSFSLRQSDPCLQPLSLAAGPPSDRLRSFGAGNDGSDRDGDDVFSGMENVDRRAWIVDCPTRVFERLKIFESHFHDGDFPRRKGVGLDAGIVTHNSLWRKSYQIAYTAWSARPVWISTLVQATVRCRA